MHKARILHIYPGQMTHHLRKMLASNAAAFSEFDNETALAWAPIQGGPDPAQAGLRTPPLQSGLEILRRIYLGDFDYVIFHSGFWPKSWFVMLAATFSRKSCLLISWGGDLHTGRGWKASVNRFLKRMCMSRFFAVVFLAEGDANCSATLYGRPRRSAVIDYFSPTCLRSADTIVIPPFDERLLRIQVGNDGSEINGHLECLEALASIDDGRMEIVLPLGYGRFREDYIERLREVATRLFPDRVQIHDDLLPAGEFDRLVDSCDAYCMASHGQRALYSVYRYLASGRPVFLPRRSELKADLEAAGFEVETLEEIRSLELAQFVRHCRTKRTNNVVCARKRLSLESIQSKWDSVLAQKRRAGA